MSWGDLWRMIRRPLPVMAVLGVLLGVFLVGGAVYSDEHGLFGDITAAWVQAVGSIAAIAVAIVIPLRDRRRRRRHYREALATLVRASFASISGAWQLMATPHAERLSLIPFQIRELDDLMDDLRSFPIVEAEAPSAIGPLRRFAGHLHGARDLLSLEAAGRFPQNGTQRLQNITTNALPFVRRVLLEIEVGLADVPPGEVAEAWPNHGAP